MSKRLKNKYSGFILLLSVIGLACTTKVSEWVMLNSEPEKYMIVYNHLDTPSGRETDALKSLESKFASANVIFRQTKTTDASMPLYSLYYEGRLIDRYKDQADIQAVMHSSLRQEIASSLLEGDLCVLLLLQSGDMIKDERASGILKETIADSPFRDVIRISELPRNLQSEKNFVSLLLNVEDDLKFINEPMLFGIFGRFRALEPLIAKGISSDNINLMIDFLTADCSCLIKDDLPGVSILYNGSWENPKTAKVNSILDANPELQHN